ncbi:MAG: hypothetical protein MUD02_04565, partial [Bacteroidales bacterium]|nr:hypothetical protein [Bacteroidales bacterium]
MKKTLKIILYVLASVLGIIILVLAFTMLRIKTVSGRHYKEAAALAGQEVQTLTADGFTYRDLNKNGKLDIYEDTRLSPDERTADLLSQMTLEEKAGTMFNMMIAMKKDGSLSEAPSLSDPFSLMIPGTSLMVLSKKMNHFNILFGTGKREMATWNNNLQKLAEKTRLGIPVTIATDPRNHFADNPLASAMAGDMSLFPEPLGLAATRDSLLVAQFAGIARREYLALGIKSA